MEFIKFLLLAVCAIICTQCNFPTVNALIGSEVRKVQPEEFPFLAAFRHVNLTDPHPTRNHICTGSLITRSHVLSAAQCIENRLISQTVIAHGSNSLVYCIEYRIQWWITYNQWSLYMNRPLEFVDNDVSVTKLWTPVRGEFHLAQLSTIPTTHAIDDHIVLVGWGVNNRRKISRKMLSSVAKVKSMNECQELIRQASGRVTVIRENLFCTHNSPYTLIKRGDFGGPVLYFNNIIGINKEIRPEVLNDYNRLKVNIHTNIDYYRDFITHALENNFLLV
ncbi:PREDICTED: trypsin-like [Ceratosolen solmsi marchali]|uniref:Trypsin-like n=1 Tax=Ceratosolen solmsi marchali TaxID=326594 RepID=A0AAJ6VMQ0_9HYME|nr:PREDICTED: trypsin-like [Ceratosolen solmsi marchali]